MKVQDVVTVAGDSSGYHEVGLHHVESHSLLVHALHHQRPVALHRDGGTGQPDHLGPGRHVLLHMTQKLPAVGLVAGNAAWPMPVKDDTR